MTHQIQPNLFDTVVELIFNSVHSPTTEVLRLANQQLQEFSQDLNFNYYLIRIVAFNNKNPSSEDRNLVENRNSQILEKIKETTRQSAFILLKNNVKKTFTSMSEDLQKSIKQLAIDCLGESSKPLRNLSGVLITGILSQCNNGFNNWPEFLNSIISALEQEKMNLNSVPQSMISGIFSALEKICEDCSDCLELDLSEEAINANNSQNLHINGNQRSVFFESNNNLQNGHNTPGQDRPSKNGANGTNGSTDPNSENNQDNPNSLDKSNCQPYQNVQDSPLYKLLPLFIDYFTYSLPDVQAKAVACCNHFIISRTGILVSLMLDKFIHGLFNLITNHHQDSNYEEVQKQICKALVLLLEVQNEALVEHMPGIVDYMLHQSQNPNRNIAIEACEFWLTLAEQKDISEEVLLSKIDESKDEIINENGLDVNNRISKLVPILTFGMRYEENDPILLRADSEESDAFLPDRDQDVKSRCYSNKKNKVSRRKLVFYF